MKKWTFPSVKNIGIKGFNDIGEEFKDNPMFHLAKEICQNSLDTKVTSAYKSNGEPIRVEFKEFLMTPESIPGNENGEFKKIIEDEYIFNKNYYENDNTVPDFYKNALKLLNEGFIKCLRISDFNTTGLIGSDKKSHTPWIDLTKNAGVTDKPEGSAGSKGKGKFASFICSEFYTVFYSTKANDGLDASCGISRISGYEKEDGTTTIGEGYYEDDERPLNYCLNLDNSFKRDSYGTDIYVLGFKSTYENWKEKMCASIIENFFVAIYKGDLVVTIGNDYQINRFTIKEYIDNPIISKHLLPDTKCYYNILTADEDDVLLSSCDMFEKEDVILKLRKDDMDLSDINKVAIVRLTGMKIFDMTKLPRLGKYHGILYMQGVKVNDYFRKLENATHSNWSADRVQDSADAKRKIKEIRDFVMESIKNLMGNITLDEVSATGVGEILPDEDEFSNSEDSNKNESIENEIIKTIEIIETGPEKVKKEEKITNEENDELGLVLDENGQIIDTRPEVNSIDPYPGPNPNPMPPKENRYLEVNKKILPKKLRLMANNGYYKLILALNDNEEIIKICVNIYGESGTEKAIILNAKCSIKSKLFGSTVPVEISDNSIILKNLNKDYVYDLEFYVKSDAIWPLEVKVYGEK